MYVVFQKYVPEANSVTTEPQDFLITEASGCPDVPLGENRRMRNCGDGIVVQRRHIDRFRRRKSCDKLWSEGTDDGKACGHVVSMSRRSVAPR